MRITKRQLRRIIKEEKARILAEQKVRRAVRRKLTEQPGMPELQLTLGSGGDQPTLTHAEAYDDVSITDYGSSAEMMVAVSEMLGPYPEAENVSDEEVGIGDMPLNRVYDAVMDMAGGME